jgi:hypothetical protein
MGRAVPRFAWDDMRLVIFLAMAWSAACLTGAPRATFAQTPAAPPAEVSPAPEHLPVPTNPLADNALQPRIIPPTPSAYENAPKESLIAWVAKVNGDPICVRFFSRRVAANRAAAYREFAEEAGATPGADFWTNRYGAETPREWVVKRALAECVRMQVELGWGKREGLLPGTSYGEFLRALDRENERRRAALAKGEPIYGPQQYGEDEYFTYVMNNLRLRLEERVGEEEGKKGGPGGLKPALQAYYEKVKERYFDRGYRVKVWAIEIIVGNREGWAQSYTLEEAKARITEAKARLDKGEPFEQVAAAYNENGGLHEQVFDFESRSADKTHRAGVRDEAMRLSEGETSGILFDFNTFYLLKCLEKEKLGLRPFEDVEDPVRRMYQRERYEQRVAELVKAAAIKVDQAELDRLEIR